MAMKVLLLVMLSNKFFFNLANSVWKVEFLKVRINLFLPKVLTARDSHVLDCSHLLE